MTLITIIGQMLGAFALITMAIAAMAVFSWHLVYDICRCRNHPIGKSLLVCFAGLWLVFGIYSLVI